MSEEAPIGEDLAVPTVRRVLEEHAAVMRLLTQPSEQWDGCIERLPVDVD